MIAHSNTVAARFDGEAPCPRAALRGGAGNVYAGEVEIDATCRSVVDLCVPAIGHGVAIGVLHAAIDVPGLER